MPDVTIHIPRKGAIPAQKPVGAAHPLPRACLKASERPVDTYCAKAKARGQSHG